MPGKSIDPLDRFIAHNIRRYRRARGLSQQALAAAIGVTCQQIQKYESGANRVAASRLVRIGLALRVPLAEFFRARDATSSAPAKDRTLRDADA